MLYDIEKTSEGEEIVVDIISRKRVDPMEEILVLGNRPDTKKSETEEKPDQKKEKLPEAL